MKNPDTSEFFKNQFSERSEKLRSNFYGQINSAGYRYMQKICRTVLVQSTKIERSGFLHNKKIVQSAETERSGFLHHTPPR